MLSEFTTVDQLPAMQHGFIGVMQSTKFMLGIITAVISSNWLGEWVHSDGIYETDLEADGSVIFLKPSPPRSLLAKDVRDVMSRHVWYGSDRWHFASLVEWYCSSLSAY